MLQELFLLSIPSLHFLPLILIRLNLNLNLNLKLSQSFHLILSFINFLCHSIYNHHCKIIFLHFMIILSKFLQVLFFLSVSSLFSHHLIILIIQYFKILNRNLNLIVYLLVTVFNFLHHTINIHLFIYLLVTVINFLHHAINIHLFIIIFFHFIKNLYYLCLYCFIVSNPPRLNIHLNFLNTTTNLNFHIFM